jgi:hypothetical protein
MKTVSFDPMCPLWTRKIKNWTKVSTNNNGRQTHLRKFNSRDLFGISINPVSKNSKKKTLGIL